MVEVSAKLETQLVKVMYVYYIQYTCLGLRQGLYKLGTKNDDIMGDGFVCYKEGACEYSLIMYSIFQ